MEGETMTAQKQQAQAVQFKLIKATEAKPPQRFGRATIEGSLWWKQFIAEAHEIGPNQYGEFKGFKKDVQSTRRRVIKHICDKKLPLYTYIVTNDDGSQSLYIVGK
jgi:hypothetical protein